MRRLLVTGGIVCLGLVFSARAQETENSPAPGTSVAPASEATPASETAEVEVLAEAVPDNQKAGRSAEHVARMREILADVLKHLADAREERDVVKLNCVNEKLTAIKGLLKISEQADVAMQEALARRNSEVAQHEFEKIAVAVTKCEQLYADSEACVGELAVYSGETEVTVDVEEEPAKDLSEGGEETVEVIVRPAASSGYQ